MSLYQAQAYLPPDEFESSPLVQDFITETDRLRSKLAQIAGAEALTQFDRERDELMHPDSDTPSAVVGGNRSTNEQLAHELLLNPKFQLPEHGHPNENPVFSCVRQSVHPSSFWDGIIADLSLNPPSYVLILRTLADIRDGISKLAPGVGGVYISQVIDIDRIKLQADQGFFTWTKCASLLNTVVGVICLLQDPQRAQETLQKWNECPAPVCNALKFLLNRINLLCVEATNARLRLIAPNINDHALDYERKQLQTRLDAGTISLERTEAWIQKAVQQNPTATLMQGVHRIAMVNLVSGGIDLNPDNCPETLSFDTHRLAALEAEFRFCTMAAVMLNQAAGRLTQTQLISLSNLFLRSGVESNMQIILSRISTNADADLVALGKTFTQDTQDAVHKLMHKRMRTLFLQLVHNDDDSMATGQIAALGAARFLLQRIKKNAALLKAVVDLDWRVHGARYDAIIRAEASLES